MVVHPWLPNSPENIKKEMLKTIGVEKVEDLFADIPEGARFKGDWDKLEIGFGKPLSEIEIRKYIEKMFNKNKVFMNPPPFLGGGAWPHYVPAVVKYIMSRAEFYTAYTPYQPEISQGLMQSLFEYQSMMADLLEMEIVNSSMYDWASAAAESFLMAVRIQRRKYRVLVPSTLNPYHEPVIRAYVEPKGLSVEKVKYDKETGLMDLEDLKEKLSPKDVAAVYIENPSFLGFIEENAKAIGEIAHDYGALFVMGVDPISLGVLEAPGRLGADMAVGEGQPLGLGMNFGGPYLGIFAAKWSMRIVRQMPGRIMGLTTTTDGKEKGFAMILQTREQHIRREKATSNICTNEMLCALGA
ncbi:MAG: aminomethyl-transferring glycine dehydrogenase subunit GcvPA, partial [Thermoprotei archaeon]